MSNLKTSVANQSIHFSVFDTAGDPITGRVYSDFTTSYLRCLNGIPLAAAATAITEATLGSINAAHTDGGIIHIGDGLYRFDLPDAVTASGADAALMSITSGTSGDAVVYQDVIPITTIQADLSAILTDTGTTIPTTLAGTLSADIVSISGDSAAADNLEAILDGTGATLTLDNVLDVNLIEIYSDVNQAYALGQLFSAAGSSLHLKSTVDGAPALKITAEGDSTPAIQINATGLASSAIESNDTTGYGIEGDKDGIGLAAAAHILTTPGNKIATDTSGAVALPSASNTQLAEIKAKTDTIGSGSVTVVSPVASDLTVSMVEGDDYLAVEGRAIDFSNSAGTWGNGDIAGAEVSFKVVDRRDSSISLTIAGSVEQATGTQMVRVPITTGQTALLTRPGRRYSYQVRLTLPNEHIETIVEGEIDATSTLFA